MGGNISAPKTRARRGERACVNETESKRGEGKRGGSERQSSEKEGGVVSRHQKMFLAAFMLCFSHNDVSHVLAPQQSR